MAWIFDSCRDEVGGCVRQYVVFGISLVIALLALYSTIKTRRREGRVTFQLLPLVINTVTSFVIFGFFSQADIYNTRLSLLLIEVYSYFLMVYGFIFSYFKQKTSNRNNLRILNRMFATLSVLSLVCLAVLGGLAAGDVIKCSQEQGIGSIVLVGLELPILALIILFSRKSKRIIYQSLPISENKRPNSFLTQHLLEQQDLYVRLKILQINMVIFASVFSIMLHVAEIILFEIADNQFICDPNSNRIIVTNHIQLVILSIENASDLFPHFIIPFIVWYLPAKISHQRKSLCRIENNDSPDKMGIDISHRKEVSKLVLDVETDELIRQRLNPLHRTKSRNNYN